MENLAQQYQVWNDFLKKWPVATIEAMSITQYTDLDNKDTFTYWLEHRLKEYGSIRGGSSYKFGIFKKSNNDKQHSKSNYVNDDKYAWHCKYGDTAVEAFTTIKANIIAVIRAVKKADLLAIEQIELAHSLKWKIAYHYQSQQQPCVLGIFSLDALQCYFKRKITMTEVNQALEEPLSYTNLFPFTARVWQEWDQAKSIRIWKLSHGYKQISTKSSAWLDKLQYVTVHEDTAKSQGDKFASAVQVGDYVSLSRSGDLHSLVRITGGIVRDPDSPLGDEWQLRPYEIINKLDEVKGYNSIKKGWSPNYHNTLFLVPSKELSLVESEILLPFFDLTLRDLTTDTETLLPSEVANEQPILTGRNIIFYGPPGTGKTYRLQNMSKDSYTDINTGKERYRFVTFHQSYGYEEFIEGLRAETDVASNIRYIIKPGAFTKLCDDARLDPSRKYAMFIDEINRGNISKIFGELITLIEPDKREGATNPLSVHLAYSGDSFSVPANVDIIGSMNTADRSLALMDTALRRRFDFKERGPDYDVLSSKVVHGIVLAELLQAMNLRIEYLYDREHVLGHAFFMPVVALLPDQDAAFDELKSVFKNKLLPLLEEYFFEDWHKIRLVLADNQKTTNLQFITAVPQTSVQLVKLFGSDSGLKHYGEQGYCYAYNDSAFDNLLSYQQILGKDCSNQTDLHVVEG